MLYFLRVFRLSFSCCTSSVVLRVCHLHDGSCWYERQEMQVAISGRSDKSLLDTDTLLPPPLNDSTT